MAEPYDESKDLLNDNMTGQIVAVPADLPSFDEYLIALADAGKFNVIADATDRSDEPIAAFPATKMGKLNRWTPKLYLVLLDMTQEKKLSMVRYNKNTFILWDEPSQNDIVKHAKQVAGPSLLDNETESQSVTNLYHFLIDNELLNVEDLSPGGHVDIPLNKIALPYQEKIKQIALKLAMDKSRFQRAWFDDRFWQQAVMRIVLNKDNSYVLEVAGFYQQRVVGTQLFGLQGK